MLGGVFSDSFLAAAKVLTKGLPHLFGGETYMPIAVKVVYVILLTTVVWFYRRAKTAGKRAS